MGMNDKIAAKVEAMKDLSHDTKCFTLSLEKPMTFEAGQFVMVNVPMKDTFVRRAYSIACKPGNGMVELCINLVNKGIGSEFFFNLKEGEHVKVDGPYGVFKLKESNNDKFFICTGTGVAPLRSMIHHLLEQGAKENITLIFGKRNEGDILYRKEFEEMAKKYPNFHYIPTLSMADDNWKGERGYVQDVMKKYIKIPESIDFYICGLRNMVDDVSTALLQLNISRNNIMTEKFV